MAKQPQHTIDISVEGKRIDGWVDYEIGSSMTEAVDHFSMSRPFTSDTYRALQVDSQITVRIDNTPVITGYIDTVEKDSKRDTSKITITGRDKVGRLVQESAPTIAYDGLDFVSVAKLLADPWFTTVSLSGARDRIVRLGKKGRKAAAGNEALVVKVKKKTWQHEPGQSRYKIINDLASEASYMVWSSADGKELIIGKPNQSQGVQFLIANPSSESSIAPTALAMKMVDSVADRYSLIMALGSGRGDAANYGKSTVTRRDVVRNGPGIDGTGLDFIRPKRLILAERTLLDLDEAHQFAQRDMNRRDFHKRILTATMPAHGQITGGTAASLYTPNTIARVIDDEVDPPMDDLFVIYACTYHGSREGETTDISAVPRGTVFVQ